MNKVVSVRSGGKKVKFSCPEGAQIDIIRQKSVRPIRNIKAAIKAAISRPSGMPSLKDLVQAGQRVSILFTDATRACPDDLIIPLLLDELLRCGLKKGDITLICARGMHRPSTPAELRRKLGPACGAGYRVMDSEALSRKRLVNLGETASGIPILIDREAAGADHIISTGIVEPHQFAGYSGGAKTLAVGAAGQETISSTHSPRFIDSEGCHPGSIECNPFQQTLWEIARKAGLRFVVNMIQSDSHQALAVMAGEPRAVYSALVRKARSIFEIPVRHLYDAAVVFAPPPKDSSFYQASRAVTYLSLSPHSPLRRGGCIVLAATLEDEFGVGRFGAGLGEDRFRLLMETYDARGIVRKLATGGMGAGEQRAYMLAKAILRNRVYVTGGRSLLCREKRRLSFSKSIDEALARLQRRQRGKLRILVVPSATEIIVKYKP